MNIGIAESFNELIGNTPLYHLKRWEDRVDANANVLAKLEYMNPLGSSKDRVALEMIEYAESLGILREGATIIEPTTGNIGVSIASVARTKGYKVILTIPNSTSVHKLKLLQAYGAEVIFTDSEKGMSGAVEKSKELLRSVKNATYLGQFTNPANVEAHYTTTGPEIWKATKGKVDIIVAGVGTGGTITGVSKYLKEKNPRIQAVAVESADSPLLSKGECGSHKLEGIGTNFYPAILDTSLLDDAIAVETKDAYDGVRKLIETEGLLIGISSGAVLHVTMQLSKMIENAGKTIVAILPDSGERYLASECFDMEE